MGQYQLRVIIYINFLELEYIIPHAECHDHRTISSVGEVFSKAFTIYGHDGHLDDVTWTIYINLLSPFSRRLHRKFGFDGSREEAVENNSHIHVLSCGAGANNPLV